MDTSIEEALSVWYEGEELLDRLSPFDPDHETVRLSIARLAATCARLADLSASSRVALADAHATLETARRAIQMVGGDEAATRITPLFGTAGLRGVVGHVIDAAEPEHVIELDRPVEYFGYRCRDSVYAWSACSVDGRALSMVVDLSGQVPVMTGTLRQSEEAARAGAILAYLRARSAVWLEGRTDQGLPSQ